MQPSGRELWMAFIAILIITLLYLLMVVLLGSIPAASGFFGHTLGILGFILILVTEVLYSVRKRSRRAWFGSMSSWLEFHVFTGLVGAYLVLLHSAWRYNGIAGLAMLFTVMIVVSGFIGRYIFTYVPRTAEGVTLEVSELEQMIRDTEAEISRLRASYPKIDGHFRKRLYTPKSAEMNPGSSPSGGVFRKWQVRLDWWRTRRQLKAKLRSSSRQLHRLTKRQRALQRQIDSYIIARKLFAWWHLLHVPLSLILILAAVVHMGGAIYYATLLR